ncbi:MAG: Lrp/AsnC ligand binding domain-containing protein, partial [Alphaproteobacteria bacterium]
LHTVLRDQPEIVDVWALTGQADYLLRVYCRDLKQLNRLVHDVLLRHKVVAKVESKIVMNQVKSGGALPIPR